MDSVWLEGFVRRMNEIGLGPRPMSDPKKIHAEERQAVDAGLHLLQSRNYLHLFRQM